MENFEKIDLSKLPRAKLLELARKMNPRPIDVADPSLQRCANAYCSNIYGFSLPSAQEIERIKKRLVGGE